MAPDPASISRGDVGFRYSNYDAPLWVRENTDEGRWHRPGDGPTQYLALAPSGAWAELIRHEGLTTEEETAEVRTLLFIIRLTETGIADYRSFERAGLASFDPAALVDEDYSACQVEGARLRREGFGGVLAPSAALPGVLNLTLFGARYPVRWDARPRLPSAVPAATAARGAPPRGVVAQVRHRRAEHSLLRQYEIMERAEGVQARARREQEE
jgi:hypothetical protein